MMRSDVVKWSLAFLLFGAVAVSAAQPETETKASTQTSSASSAGKAGQGLKVTIIKSVATSSGEHQNTTGANTATASAKDQRGVGATSTKPSTKPTIQSRTKTNATSVPASKPQANPPAAKPKTPPPHQAPSESGAAHQTPQPSSEGVISVEGSVVGLDLNATPLAVRLALPVGPFVALTADAATIVVKEGRAVTLADVELHDEARVVYGADTHLLRSIDIKKAADPQPSTSPSVNESIVPGPLTVYRIPSGRETRSMVHDPRTRWSTPDATNESR